MTAIQETNNSVVTGVVFSITDVSKIAALGHSLWRVCPFGMPSAFDLDASATWWQQVWRFMVENRCKSLGAKSWLCGRKCYVRHRGVCRKCVVCGWPRLWRNVPPALSRPGQLPRPQKAFTFPKQCQSSKRFCMLKCRCCPHPAHVPRITWPWTLEPSVVYIIYSSRITGSVNFFSLRSLT